MQNIILKPREERRILGGHPWIFSNEIDTKASPLKGFEKGECVNVQNSQGRMLGSAYVNPNTLLCGRLYSRKENQELDAAFIKQKIIDALALRERFFDAPYYRLFFGDSDFLSGLIIDRFGEYFILQMTTAGIDRVKETIVAVLVELFQPKGILLRNDIAYRELEGLPLEVTVAYGEIPGEVEIKENGFAFMVPLQKGQKTGWFYDQRNTRAKLQKYVKGKKVLDVFSYLGSFAIHAGQYGATAVTAVDSSAFACEYIAKNATLNGLDKKIDVTIIEQDAFDALKALQESGELFDVVLVDPPAFIKRQKDFQQGFRAYERINHFALNCLKPGGILISSSCSMHLKDEDLKKALNAAACSAKAQLQIIDYGREAEDHPEHPAIPETHYLKTFVCRKL